ncbi:MAG: hypothetical protein WDM96_09520, partial [Lacunisphaera sp.]
VSVFQGGKDAIGIDVANGATLDLSGGGDLFAYRFVAGTGGKTDLLDPAQNSFAIVPGYADQYAPFAPNNSAAAAQEILRDDPGYILPSGFVIGDRIHLAGGGGLPAGDYTLLPARYALLPGAYLVTPRAGAATAGAMPNAALPLGSTLMSGYTYNAFDANGRVQAGYRAFEVASAQVVAKRAEYDTFGGNAFFAAAATKNEQAIPRGGLDAGNLILAVQAAPKLPARLDLQGTVALTPWPATAGAAGGRVGMVDLTTSANIRIGGVRNPASNELWLDPTQLNGLGSVLVGGTRETGTEETVVHATTSSITIDQGAALHSAELLFASTDGITIADGATLTATASPGFVAEALTVTGDGALVRVAADATAATTRLAAKDADGAALPFAHGELTVGAATFKGSNIGLDAAIKSTIAADATLGDAQSYVSLSSGRIALQFSSQLVAPTDALVLAGKTLTSLGGVAGLSLTSYSTIDFLGDGTLGLGANGQRTLQTLGLQAAALRGYSVTAMGVVLAAADVTLAGTAAGVAPVFTGTAAGALRIKAETIHLGSDDVALEGFASAALTAGRAVSLEGTADAAGGLHAIGADLTITTPVVVGAAAADQAIVADGALSFVAPTPAVAATATSGLGASLALAGKTVAIGTAIKLPSGSIDVHATAGNLMVAGSLDVGGVTQRFFDATRSTDGGLISLRADAGDVDISGSRVGVGRFGDDTGAWAGNAGSVAVVAQAGEFFATHATLVGAAGTGVLGGNFSLDARAIDADATGTSRLATLHQMLATGGFDRNVALEVRQGNVVVDTGLRAHDYALTADRGSIAVNAVIDASGLVDPANPARAAVDPTGGTIALSASGDVALGAGASLDVEGYSYDNAGKGGSILLAAGNYTVDPATGVGAADTSASVTIATGRNSISASRTRSRQRISSARPCPASPTRLRPRRCWRRSARASRASPPACSICGRRRPRWATVPNTSGWPARRRVRRPSRSKVSRFTMSPRRRRHGDDRRDHAGRVRRPD